MSRWGATHVLSVERDGKMVEMEVRREGNSLFTVLEWTGHEMASWTLEGGRLCLEGEPWEGKALLLPCPGERLTLGAVLAMVRKVGHDGRVPFGPSEVARIARELGRQEREVIERLATLAHLGLIVERVAVPREAEAVH